MMLHFLTFIINLTMNLINGIHLHVELESNSITLFWGVIRLVVLQSRWCHYRILIDSSMLSLLTPG